MAMTLSIAVQLVDGHADYLVKMGTPIFGIHLAPAGRTLHKHLTICVLTIWFLEDRRVTVKKNVSPTGN
jgi:hypothetical protein